MTDKPEHTESGTEPNNAEGSHSETQRSAMSTMGRVVAVNLGILFLYSLASLGLSSGAGGSEAELGGAASMAVFMLLHLFLLLVTAIALLIMDKKAIAKGCFISLPVVLLVGFGSCLGILTL